MASMLEKTNRKKSEEYRNIQVFVRLRPLNQREMDIKSLSVVEAVNGREVVIRPTNNFLHHKKFTFDRVFSPQSKQIEVYRDVVSPLISEVLLGYNCTVFAYGQTGTGKTHTMVGEASTQDIPWQNDPLAGIIPRALSQLFDELRPFTTEYTVRVSYLEIYNEELFDLLSRSNDNSKLRIYEDVTRKGTNIVNGLEELTVVNKNDVYKIVAQGQEKKRVAATHMNSQSSRSHTVFTIIVHMKENSQEEEYVKVGKLNLVDLAGSENISKAGSDNPAKRERARECVNINQSLLTLGRVITALVEQHPHIPYRESKLTRLLQESLGGRTKTSIIATISPGHKDLEETLSTLEYANRAKNIKNKPEINQKMTKKAMLKDFADEIDRLKKELQVTRDKNGIYLPTDTYAEITCKQVEQKKEIEELLLKILAMENEKDRMELVFEDLKSKLESSEGQLTETITKLNNTQSILHETSNKLVYVENLCSEQRYLVDYQVQKERALANEARQLLSVADAATTDAVALHNAVNRRSTIEQQNLDATQRYRRVSAAIRYNMRATADILRHVETHLITVAEGLESQARDSTEILSDSKTKMEALMKNTVENAQIATQTKDNVITTVNGTLTEHQTALTNVLLYSHQSTKTALTEFAEAVVQCLRNAEQIDLSSQLTLLLEEWVSSTCSQLQITSSTHGDTHALATTSAQAHAAATRAARDAAVRNADTRARHVQKILQAYKADEEQNKKLLDDNIAKIQREREMRETILEQWIERERFLLEEKIKERIKTENEYLEAAMESHLKSVEEQKKTFEARVTRNVQMLMELLTENEREMQRMEVEYLRDEKETDKCVNELNKLTEKYKEENAVVESSMSCVSGRVLAVAEQVKSRLLAELQDSERNIRSQTERLVLSDLAAARASADDVQTALKTVYEGCTQAVDGLLAEIERNSTSTTHELVSISSTVSRCVELVAAQRTVMAKTLKNAKTGVLEFYSRILQDLKALQELEERCLQDEYTVYNPSGCTPARPHYSYPRQLTAASPHEKVLRRYRDSRPLPRCLEDDDVTIVEDEIPNGNSNRSASVDSAPPNGSTLQALDSQSSVHASIVQSVSDTDLRKDHHNDQGKENLSANCSMNLRKPTRLPAPVTVKNILPKKM